MWSRGYKTFSTGCSKSAKQGNPVPVAVVVFREHTEYQKAFIFCCIAQYISFNIYSYEWEEHSKTVYNLQMWELKCMFLNSA